MRIKKIDVKQLAHYRCSRCKKEYHTKPHGITCECGNKYLEWLNIEQCLEYVYEREEHEDERRDSGDAGPDSQSASEAT
jgi:hypothetical protein